MKKVSRKYITNLVTNKQYDLALYNINYFIDTVLVFVKSEFNVTVSKNENVSYIVNLNRQISISNDLRNVLISNYCCLSIEEIKSDIIYTLLKLFNNFNKIHYRVEEDKYEDDFVYYLYTNFKYYFVKLMRESVDDPVTYRNNVSLDEHIGILKDREHCISKLIDILDNREINNELNEEWYKNDDEQSIFSCLSPDEKKLLYLKYNGDRISDTELSKYYNISRVNFNKHKRKAIINLEDECIKHHLLDINFNSNDYISLSFDDVQDLVAVNTDTEIYYASSKNRIRESNKFSIKDMTEKMFKIKLKKLRRHFNPESRNMRFYLKKEVN